MFFFCFPFQLDVMLSVFHAALGLRRHDATWHRADLRGEIAELREAVGQHDRLSEMSDVVYTASRGIAAGHHLPALTRLLPHATSRWCAIAYMCLKYTLRFGLFASAGALTPYISKVAPPRAMVRTVRNPAKLSKVGDIAREFGRSPEIFAARVILLKKIWPILR